MAVVQGEQCGKPPEQQIHIAQCIVRLV